MTTKTDAEVALTILDRLTQLHLKLQRAVGEAIDASWVTYLPDDCTVCGSRGGQEVEEVVLVPRAAWVEVIAAHKAISTRARQIVQELGVQARGEKGEERG